MESCHHTLEVPAGVEQGRQEGGTCEGGNNKNNRCVCVWGGGRARAGGEHRGDKWNLAIIARGCLQTCDNDGVRGGGKGE
jgi:hypothetical protein